MSEHENGDDGAKNDGRKLFIGGLSWETKDQGLKDYFGKFGEVEAVNIKTDPNTGRSRGFCFLVFKEASAVDAVMAAGEHVIDGKKVDPKKAKARTGKIFVGGLKPDITNEDITEYFSAFGTIVETAIPMDKTKNERKGFCFITFEEEAVAKKLIAEPKQTIKGIEVDVKKATPSGGDAGGRGGRGGGGRGGRGGRGGGAGWGGGYDPYAQGYGGGYGYDAYAQGYAAYGAYPPGYAGYDYSGYGGYGQYRHAPY